MELWCDRTGHDTFNEASECPPRPLQGPRGTFTLCSSSKVSWQHSQKPLLFLGTVVGVERGLFSPALGRAQPSTPLQKGQQRAHPAWQQSRDPGQGSRWFPKPRKQQ